VTIVESPPSGLMRRRQRAQFSAFDDPDVELAQAMETLRFELRPRWGGRLTVDLNPLGRPELARAFARTLWELCQISGSIGAVTTAKQYIYSVTGFFDYLALNHPEITRIEDVTWASIDGFNEWLREKKVHPSSSHARLSKTILCLRRMRDAGAPLQPRTIERLSFIRSDPIVQRRPRDAYDGATARALRKAAKADILQINKRLTTDADKLPASLVGDSPYAASAYRVLLAEIDREGSIDHEDSVWRVLRGRRRRRALPKDHMLDDLHRRRYLALGDLIPFIVLLMLDTGLEPECCKTLRVDCLKNPSRGYVDIEYCKPRSRGAEWKRLRVRDGGPTSPGGLIRMLIKLTENARRFVPTDTLWIYFSRASRLTAGFRDLKHPLAAWPKRHDLRDAKGAPLRLLLPRLRKTNRAEWYVKTEGQMQHFAVGHTSLVAANHYADIPALRHIHERTVADGLQDALDAALEPRVLPLEEEKAVRADPKSVDLPVPPDEVIAFLDGDQDVWLASCSGFYNSPFGKRDEPCPVPFWGCLGCSNAVITSRKLPAVIAFLDFMLAQRETLNAPDWAAKFGAACVRIRDQILPAFPDAVVDGARTIAAERSDLLYLPPEASAS